MPLSLSLSKVAASKAVKVPFARESRDHRAKMARVMSSPCHREASGVQAGAGVGEPLAEVVCDDVECGEEGVHHVDHESAPSLVRPCMGVGQP
jgi:hypothetical protein